MPHSTHTYVTLKKIPEIGRLTSGPDHITEETLDSLTRLWADHDNRLPWHCLFVSPPWLKAWIDRFNGTAIPYLRAVRVADDVVGVAALMIDHNCHCASFAGDTSVCDYLDFVIAPGRETDFFACLVRDLRRQSVQYLRLEHVRSDSSILTVFKDMAVNLGCQISSQAQDVSLALKLPDTWDKYLLQLPAKQRHEIRRKLRRLYEAGIVSYVLADKPVDTGRVMDIFLKLFRQNHPHKAAFMTHQMTGFFRALAKGLAENGMLKLFTLKIDAVPAAVVMCIDFRSTRYLYNNAYDQQFSRLSVGFLSKVLSLKDGIQSGLKAYDFLKGGEIYKKRLGGRPLQLYNCRVDLD